MADIVAEDFNPRKIDYSRSGKCRSNGRYCRKNDNPRFKKAVGMTDIVAVDFNPRDG